MYEIEPEPKRLDVAAFKRGRDPILAHVGPIQRCLEVHSQHCEQYWADPQACPHPPHDYLWRRITSERTLLACCLKMSNKGPKAPGPDGQKLDFSLSVAGDGCDLLSALLKVGIYSPGPVRRVKIPKPGKPGQFRRIVIENLGDRIVSTSAKEVLQPLVHPRFSPMTFGVSRAGRENALATALRLAESQGRWVWISDDVKCAFDQIPLRRCFDACRVAGIPEDVLELLQLIAFRGQTRGILQGSAISMLLLNLYFDHFLDRPWFRAHPERPVIRYVDDLLLPCTSVDEAASLYASLSSRLVTVGTPLKGNTGTGIVDLKSGQAIEWLGYRIQFHGGSPAITISERAWERLQTMLDRAHRSPWPPLAAERSVRGWVRSVGPCYEAEDQPAVIARVRALAAAQSFLELPADKTLLSSWERAAERWKQRYAEFDPVGLPSRMQKWDQGLQWS